MQSEPYQFRKLPNNIAVSMLFVGLIFLNFYFATRGLDLSDQGYLLAMQGKLIEARRYYPILGTNYFAALLNDLFAGWSYLASRFFAALVPLLVCLTFWLALGKSLQVSYRSLAVMALLTIWAGRSPLAEWSYYSTLSGLLISCVIILLASYLLTRKLSSFIASLFFIAGAILVKITNIVFIGLFALFLFYLHRSQLERRQILYIYILLFSSILGTLAVLLVFKDTSVLTAYWQGLSDLVTYANQDSSTHSAWALLLDNWNDAKQYFIPSASFILFLCLAQLCNRFSHPRSAQLQAALVIVYLALQQYFAWFEWNGLFFCLLLSLLVILFDRKAKQFHFLACSGLYFLLLGSSGSNNALKAAFVAEPLVCFIVIQYLFYAGMVVTYRKTIACGLIVMVVAGFSNRMIFSYRDLSRWKLTEPVALASLKGIYTNSEKATVLRELYHIRGNLEDKAETALIYPSAPLLYKILELESITANPWPNLNSVNELKVELAAREKPADIAIRLKRNPRKKEWPVNLQPIERDQDFQSIAYLDSYIEEQGYRLLKETEIYRFYVLSSK